MCWESYLFFKTAQQLEHKNNNKEHQNHVTDSLFFPHMVQLKAGAERVASMPALGHILLSLSLPLDLSQLRALFNPSLCSCICATGS